MPARNKTPSTGDPPLLSLARQVRGWADTLINVAGNATDMGLGLVQARTRDPGRRATIAKAGRQLRGWREAAGLTLDELSQAVGLGDARLIEQAEGGLVALPFDLILRLAGVLGRRDPLPVALSLTRQYNPELWKTLEGLGVGKLVVQGTREREMANVYRGCDAARALDDTAFAEVLAFTRQAFEMAVAFRQPPDRPAPAATPSRASPAGKAAPSGTATATAPRSTRPRARRPASGD